MRGVPREGDDDAGGNPRSVARRVGFSDFRHRRRFAADVGAVRGGVSCRETASGCVAERCDADATRSGTVATRRGSRGRPRARRGWGRVVFAVRRARTRSAGSIVKVGVPDGVAVARRESVVASDGRPSPPRIRRAHRSRPRPRRARPRSARDRAGSDPRDGPDRRKGSREDSGSPRGGQTLIRAGKSGPGGRRERPTGALLPPPPRAVTHAERASSRGVARAAPVGRRPRSPRAGPPASGRRPPGPS